MSKPTFIQKLAGIRFYLLLLALAGGSVVGERADASIVVGNLPLVGTDNNNSQDKLADVVAVVDAYNAAKDPDLINPTALFKKTDDDAAFVFNAANGFSFFADVSETIAVTSASALHNLTTAYFRYSGPESIAYYSVKSAKGFSLYAFQPASLNLLTRDDTNQDISHVSFWSGDATAVPEVSSICVWMLMLVGIAGTARCRRSV